MTRAQTEPQRDHVGPWSPTLGPADRTRDRTLLDCLGELRVVAFILIGVGRRESNESLLHFGAGAEVIVDRGGVTAARVCAGQHSPAGGRELRQPAGDGLTLGMTLPSRNWRT